MFARHCILAFLLVFSQLTLANQSGQPASLNLQQVAAYEQELKRVQLEPSIEVQRYPNGMADGQARVMILNKSLAASIDVGNAVFSVEFSDRKGVRVPSSTDFEISCFPVGKAPVVTLSPGCCYGRVIASHPLTKQTLVFAQGVVRVAGRIYRSKRVNIR